MIFPFSLLRPFDSNIVDIAIKEYNFTIEEIKSLYRLIEHQYIPYDDEEVNKIVTKIMNIVKDHEKDVMANGSSKTT